MGRRREKNSETPLSREKNLQVVIENEKKIRFYEKKNYKFSKLQLNQC
jgi:hypothetical protein